MIQQEIGESFFTIIELLYKVGVLKDKWCLQHSCTLEIFAVLFSLKNPSYTVA